MAPIAETKKTKADDGVYDPNKDDVAGCVVDSPGNNGFVDGVHKTVCYGVGNCKYHACCTLR